MSIFTVFSATGSAALTEFGNIGNKIEHGVVFIEEDLKALLQKYGLHQFKAVELAADGTVKAGEVDLAKLVHKV
ncbi:MAG TPA: hypothetical protein VNX68_02585 [Nitrosopumilaceae archaeon]|jgi:hypothetical protein|nr:hypothetical protein [Nitrosopumilaceae archaeon]